MNTYIFCSWSEQTKRLRIYVSLQVSLAQEVCKYNTSTMYCSSSCNIATSNAEQSDIHLDISLTIYITASSSVRIWSYCILYTHTITVLVIIVHVRNNAEQNIIQTNICFALSMITAIVIM